MAVRNSPIMDYDGGEECVDVGGIVRKIDKANLVVMVVDATGDFKFHFDDSWEDDLKVGDYVHIRGIPREAENEYTVVGVKRNPIENVSSWEFAEPNVSDWENFHLLRLFDVLGWISYTREIEETVHGIEIYCLLELDGSILTGVIGYVPETYVFKWEADENGGVENPGEFAGEPSLEQLYQNAKTFD